MPAYSPGFRSPDVEREELVLDGETFTERARAPLPHHVPFGFHGDFFPEITS